MMTYEETEQVSTAKSTPFRFLDLPSEVQLQVYEHYYDSAKWSLCLYPLPTPDKSDPDPEDAQLTISRFPPLPTELQQTCRTIARAASSTRQHCTAGYTGQFIIETYYKRVRGRGVLWTLPFKWFYKAIEPWLRNPAVPEWVRQLTTTVVFPQNYHQGQFGCLKRIPRVIRAAFPHARDIQMRGQPLADPTLQSKWLYGRSRATIASHVNEEMLAFVIRAFSDSWLSLTRDIPTFEHELERYSIKFSKACFFETHERAFSDGYSEEAGDKGVWVEDLVSLIVPLNTSRGESNSCAELF